MRARIWATGVCVLVLAAGGCNQPGIDDPSLVVIEGPNGASLRVSAQSTKAGTVDGVRVEVDKGQLRLNGKHFGAVKPSQKVKIDTEGIVTVNGVKRKEEG